MLTVFVVAVPNLAGSSGDYVQAYAVARLPSGALIQDDGATTTVFRPPAQPGSTAEYRVLIVS